MTTRRLSAPRSRILRLEVAVPPSLTEKQLRALIESVTGPEPLGVKVKPARTTGTRTVLRNRNIRHKGVYPCRRKPDPLFAAAIIWPAGVPTEGCGRTFATEKRRDTHERGEGWNPVVFPHGCLDRILTTDLRDTR